MSELYPKGQPVAQRWPKRTTLERLLDHIETLPNGCVVFTGALNRHGYGRLNLRGTVKLAHRLAYELMVGPIPEGLTIDHLCRNRACVNTFHLEAVTLAENKARGDSPAAINARKTHCPHGHPYDDENTHVTVAGVRHCRACNREKRRAEAASKVAARPVRICQYAGCDQPIPRGLRLDARYCSSVCRCREARRVAAERKAA